MVERKGPPVYYVLFCVTKYKDIEEAKSKDPDTITKHLARSRELHRGGNPIMAGAFLNNEGHGETFSEQTFRTASFKL